MKAGTERGHQRSLETLARLESLWQERRPAQATGGRSALRGFQYQFEVTVLHALRAWLRRPASQRGDPEVFAEVLADLVELSPDPGCVVTQVKLTMRKDAFDATLDEFENLEKLVMRAGPDVGPVRYRIVCSAGNVELAERWILDRKKGLDPRAPSLWDRVEIALEPRPRETALALLANDLHAPAPATTFEEALQPLIKAARSGRFDDAATEMWGVLREAERSPPSPHSLYAWTEEDRQPATVSPGEVVVGAQPLVSQLRAGCFARREEVETRLAEEVAAWLEDRAESPPAKLPVLWLAGPPGSGRSIALLQILAGIHAQNRHQVLFAGTAHANLAAGIEWSLGVAGEDSPPVIGIDDPYAAGRSRRLDATWDEVVGRLAPIRHAGDFDRLPLIIAAGGSDEANQLAKDFADHLEVEQLPLAPESEASLGSLAAWFELRAGRPVPSQVDPTQPLVHSVFEWAVDPDLRDFAIRQRRRLLDLDPGAVLAVAEQILLLNAFGLGMPAACLEEQLAPALVDRLRPFLRGAPSLSPGEEAWIAHPLIAAEMIEPWLGDLTREAIAERFVAGAVGIARHGANPEERAGPVRLLATLTRRGPDELLGDVREVAARLYPAVVEINGGIPGEQLLAWLSLRASGAALRDPDPIDVATPQLVPQQVSRPGGAALVRSLLRTAKRMTPEQQADIRDTVMGLLEREPRWPGWWDLAIAAATELPHRRLPELVADRVLIQRSAVAGRALLAVENSLPGRQVVGEAAATLAQDRTHPAWAYAWSILWGRHAGDSLAARAILWMKDVGTHRSFAWVWTPLWKDRGALRQSLRDDCVACGVEYLKAELSPVGWGRVWTSLWDDERDLRPSLSPLGEEWLAIATGTEQSYPYVWLRLWQEAGTGADRRETLRSEGARWLRIGSHQKGWHLIFGALARESRLEGLEQLGYEWLRTISPRHHDWVRVWQALRQTDWGERNREPLAEAARHWLQLGPIGHEGRSSLVKDLREDGVGWLREDGIAWLEAHGNYPDTWGWVWIALDDGGDPDLRRLGLDFCGRRMESPAWARAWTLLLKAESEPILIRFGRQWLEANPLDDVSRPHVTKTLLQADPEGDPDAVADAKAVHEMTVAWMLKVEKWGGDGDLVWQHLFDSEPELRILLLPAGRRWLRTSDPAARGWIDVWKRVWSERPGDQECLELLARQLDALEQQPFRLRKVLYALVGVEKGDREARPLLEIAIGADPTGPPPAAAEVLRAFLSQLRPTSPENPERHERLLTEAVAALVAAVEPNDLDDLFGPITCWVAEQPEKPGIVLVEAIRSLEGTGLAAVGDRYHAAALHRLEEQPDEDDLRSLEVRRAVRLHDPEKVDQILLGAAERIRESDRVDKELVSTTLRACSRVGSLDISRDLLRWAADYLAREPQRTDETLVAGCNAPYFRLEAAGSPEDADLLHDLIRAHSDWRAAFPKAPVQPLGHEGRRFREAAAGPAPERPGSDDQLEADPSAEMTK